MPTEPQTPPELAAIVVIPDRYETVSRLIEALKAQASRASMELVIVVPAGAAVRVHPSQLVAFNSWQMLELNPFSYSGAVALGVRSAHAPIVAMTEDHAFPDPNWAHTIIAAHKRDVAAVGPAMRIANPKTIVSWADFYIGYGAWAAPIQSGPVDLLMGHNGSYKRERLLEYGTRLEAVLEAETVLYWDLHSRGYALWLAGETCTAHLNFERAGPWIRALYFSARVFGGRRAGMWSPPKRVAYALAAPIIPIVRLVRARRAVLRLGCPWPLRWLLYGVMMFGLMVDGFGQFIGYVAGAGETRAASLVHEFHRERAFKEQVDSSLDSTFPPLDPA